ncbi:MAG: hypothetical protein ACHQK8_00855 [Bacteroidia bacterium]
MKKFLVIGLFFIHQFAFAQSGCVSGFMASSGKSDINLSWTINSYCSCSQNILEWATDSLFSNVLQIYSGTNNSFDHTSPDMTRINYYRINSCGYYSQVLALRAGGLNYLFYPNPVNSTGSYNATIVFQNPYNYYYQLYLFDHNGQLIKITELFNGTTYLFQAAGLQAGLYLFVIATPTYNITAAGKFYKSDN